ncbi:piggyBac transposable element-derived protein 4-like [Eupeodes corollae]|uniref:piggyBac transposable element-derived protein 4-like n=1 Tax=Eupeodes corollae TaxID=290404 RepID=UPI00249175E7|nr:piggyBac transposable element-derived protein 4-like [Eupeodes corollae]
MSDMENEIRQLLLDIDAEDDDEHVEFSDDNMEIDSEEDDEMSASNCEEEEISETRHHEGVLLGKKGFRWTVQPPSSSGRTASRNIVLKVPGCKDAAKFVKSEVEAWDLLFDSTILETIVFNTNIEIGVQRQNSASTSSSTSTAASTSKYNGDTNIDEIRALIGLLYIAGVQKQSRRAIKYMWSINCSPIFQAIMGQKRFEFLTNCIRFDDRETRDRADKLSPIRLIWEKFCFNSTKYYTPHEYCTIDEQLLGFRGNCTFRIYIPSKPDKYGIKIITMCDSRTYYMVSAIPYIGKEIRISNDPIPLQIVKKITESIHGAGRNLTMDNWFTSIQLVEEMLSRHKLTVVGTLRKNKAEIPPLFLPNRKKEILSSQFAFKDKMTLVAFTPKKGKGVVLISSLHKGKTVDPQSKKPEIINFYNSTKGGVHTFDQLVHTYSLARKNTEMAAQIFFWHA